ncbi:MAG: hypothetical protein LBB82_07955, partial [Treponema sp.]|nr:hypothetical protein [Treponema sp.]
MTIEEIQEKLESLLKKLQASGYDSIDDSIISEMETCAAPAGDQGMTTCKQLIENFVKVLKARKAGETGDE